MNNNTNKTIDIIEDIIDTKMKELKNDVYEVSSEKDMKIIDGLATDYIMSLATIKSLLSHIKK